MNAVFPNEKSLLACSIFSEKGTELPFTNLNEGFDILKTLFIHLFCHRQDPADFQEGFDDLMLWVKDPENWKHMEEELKGRGVSIIVSSTAIVDWFFVTGTPYRAYEISCFERIPRARQHSREDGPR